MDNRFDRIAIVGLGLIGASIAAALRHALPQIRLFGVDTDPRTREIALSRGWVDAAAAPAPQPAPDHSFRDFIQNEANLVILAIPADAAQSYFQDLVAWDYAGLITDAASTKSRICVQAASTLPDPAQFLPGHPMAGSEVNGIEGARADLFEGQHWILCPNADTRPEDFTDLHDLLKRIGARVVSLPREDHDRAIALISHVPHFTASALVELAARHADRQQALFRLAAGGFKDSTRIAAGSPELWTGIAFDNKTALVEGLEEMRQIIDEYLRALESDDAPALQQLLDRAARARRGIPRQWLPATESLLEVRIPMRDRKGVVAEVTTIASQVGCNIQSIEIDHVTSSSAVLSMVFTDEGDVGKLSTELIGAGYAVSLSPLSVKE